MSAAGASFESDFRRLTGWKPFRWQCRLFHDHFLPGRLPAALDLPTGLGKTSVMAVWYLALKAGADLPRRLVYVVDRRAVVDQATTVADGIKASLAEGELLNVSTLRGQYLDNRDWRSDPATPAIVVGTVDMIGSRLLFSGYGVSRRMRPYHAGLLGADTLVVLDESHLVPPFEHLLAAIATTPSLGPKVMGAVPPLRLLPLSATGGIREAAFRLAPEDRDDPEVRDRLEAEKRLQRVDLDGRKLDRALAEESWALVKDAAEPLRCLVYCNSPDLARKVRAEIERLSQRNADTALFVGSRRVFERGLAEKRLQEMGFLAGSDPPPERHAFVVATSAGEVGVDLDADHLVCDLVPLERMIQRLGRVNRRGKGRAKAVVVDAPDPALPDDLQAAARRGMEILSGLPGGDLSPGALDSLSSRSRAEPALADQIAAACTPSPLYPALNRPLVEAWSMTSLERHPGRPEVAPWLRGWREEEPQTSLVWRRYLPARDDGGQASDAEVAEFFEAAPVHLSERLETRTSRVVDLLLARAATLRKQAVQDGGLQDARRTIAILLDLDGSPRKGVSADQFTLARLGSEKDKPALRPSIHHLLSGATLVVDAWLAGLDEGLLDNLLDKKASEAPVTADGEDTWLAGEDGGPVTGFRIREGLAETYEASENWHNPFFFDLARDGEGEPTRQLVVEKWRLSVAREEDRAVARRAQSLAEHQDWTAGKAERIAVSLGLGDDLRQALVLAARLHDEGKRAAVWQRAFNAPRNGGPYAKTRGPVRPAALLGYRHEFGSLRHVAEDASFQALRPELQDLVLHLVAAHHGRARPVIETDGCDDAPSSVLAGRAQEVALRFARLQDRWGPWGLAWLEALLRAADQQASQENDERGKHGPG